MVINLAWSHAVDDMGLWDNYGNLNRDLLWILRMPREEPPSTSARLSTTPCLGVGEGRRSPLGG